MGVLKMSKKSITSLYKFISFIRTDRTLAWVLWLLAFGESSSQVLIQLHADRNWAVFPFKALLCGPLPSLVRFKQPEHATRPNPSLFSLSPKKHTHTRTHMHAHTWAGIGVWRMETPSLLMSSFSLYSCSLDTHTEKHTEKTLANPSFM